MDTSLLAERDRAQDRTGFRERLLSIMDRKDHPSYWSLMGPGATRGQLLIHYRQEWAVYVRDFPVFLSRIHARCPIAEVRRELAENLYEEENGGISGGGPHGTLFLHMMEGLGFRLEQFERVRMLPSSRAYREFLDDATLRAPWLVGLAVATIFVEGSRHEREDLDAGTTRRRGGALSADPLVVHHGLDPRYLELKRVHRKVEGSHRRSAWRAVLDNARTERERALVVSALGRALSLWLSYRDGVGRAARGR